MFDRAGKQIKIDTWEFPDEEAWNLCHLRPGMYSKTFKVRSCQQIFLDFDTTKELEVFERILRNVQFAALGPAPSRSFERALSEVLGEKDQRLGNQPAAPLPDSYAGSNAEAAAYDTSPAGNPQDSWKARVWYAFMSLIDPLPTNAQRITYTCVSLILNYLSEVHVSWLSLGVR